VPGIGGLPSVNDMLTMCSSDGKEAPLSIGGSVNFGCGLPDSDPMLPQDLNFGIPPPLSALRQDRKPYL